MNKIFILSFYVANYRRKKNRTLRYVAMLLLSVTNWIRFMIKKQMCGNEIKQQKKVIISLTTSQKVALSS
jgi:hypothetical protein